MSEKDDIVADVRKRCIVVGVGVFKWDERGGANNAGEERRGLWQAASVQYHRDLGSRCADQMPRKYRIECSRQR